jgi:poly(3-hydroxybutyrate) depolymerase
MRWHARARGLAALAAVAAVAGCGGGQDAPGSGAASTAGSTATTGTIPTTAPAAPAAPTGADHRIRLQVGGERRRFLLHVPPDAGRSRRLPLVVALHMGRNDADGTVMRDLVKLDAKADRERFLLAYPDALAGSWNAVLCCNEDDDVGFLRALVDHAKKRWRADPDRVYATGISSGASMSYRLAAALPGVFAAIAPVSGMLSDQDVPEGAPRTPVSLLAFHGRQDSVFESMQDGVAAWRKFVGCPPLRVEASGAGGKVTRAAARCRNGTEVVVYELADMGHAWPGATGDDALAAPDTPISANDLIWEFFERHPRSA